MLDNIRSLIGQSRTREALEALTDFLRTRDRNLFDECFGQLGRFNHISQESRKNVIAFDDYNRELNRINFALLDMLQQAERQFESELSKKASDTEGVVNRQSTFEYDVFLSFSSKEKEAAFIAFEHLTQAGIKTFFSSESLKKYSGQSFSKVINNALENSQHFILFCSPNSMQSNWVELEWETFFNEFHIKDSKSRRFFILRGQNFQNVTLPLILKRIHYSESISDIISVLGEKNESKSASKKVERDSIKTESISSKLIKELTPKQETLRERLQKKYADVENELPFFQSNKWAIIFIGALLIGSLIWFFIPFTTPINIIEPSTSKINDGLNQLQPNTNQTISQETTKVIVPKASISPVVQVKKRNNNDDEPDVVKFDAGSGGEFMAMAGAFASKVNAEALVDKLYRIGFINADVVKLENSANVNVVAGYYRNLERAEVAVRILKANRVDGFIRKKGGEIFKATPSALTKDNDMSRPASKPF